jgi:flagellar biosynthesis protein FliR
MSPNLITIETLLQIDHRVWPIAALMFLRILTLFFFLPVFGDAGVPVRIRIGLAIMMTLLLWPTLSNSPYYKTLNLNWEPLAALVATLREVFIGFSIGFAARMLVFASSIASHMVGINMGFQSASLFSPTTGTQESGFSVFKGWILTVCLFTFQIHHIFLTNIADSFQMIPLAQATSLGNVAEAATGVVNHSFSLGIRLGAPILLIQILVTLGLGLLNRAVPQLNALIMQFPMSFLLSFMVLYFSAGAYVRLIGVQGMPQSIAVLKGMENALGTPPERGK